MFLKNETKIKPVLAIAMIFTLLTLSVFLLLKIRNTAREYGYIGRAPLTQYTVSIEGTGKISATPDVAQVGLGVTTEGKSVKIAQDENTKKVNDIIKAVKELGVKSEDLQTSNYSIYPKYSYDRESGVSNIVGFTVSQSLSVKVRDLDKVGVILGKAGELGANQVGGVQFTIDDPQNLKDQARAKAIDNAKRKADELFKTLGVSVGRIVSFSEYSGGDIYPLKAYAEGFGVGGSPAPDIQAGSEEIQVNVSITFEIK